MIKLCFYPNTLGLKESKNKIQNTKINEEMESVKWPNTFNCIDSESSSSMSAFNDHVAVICFVVSFWIFHSMTSLIHLKRLAVEWNTSETIKKKDGEIKNRRKQYKRRPNICCLWTKYQMKLIRSNRLVGVSSIFVVCKNVEFCLNRN